MKISFLIAFFAFTMATKSTIHRDNVTYCPKVDLSIKLYLDTFAHKEDIIVGMTWTNNTDTTQYLLIDQPAISIGGPWWTSVSLINLKTKKSVLEYPSKAVLSSQIYSNAELRDKYYFLKPGQYLKEQYSLYDLAVVKAKDRMLESGTYEIQIVYCNNFSNKLTFTVR